MELENIIYPGFNKSLSELKAISKIKKKSCEIIDLRTIRPLDNKTIFASVKKTNRLVIANNFTLLHRRTPFKNANGERIICRAYVQ